MEIRAKKCNSGNAWRFVNETWSNSNGWGHKTTVFKNAYEFEAHKVKYYNRTWEMYTYQSCMLNAVGTIYDDALYRFIENYKTKNDITRFKKGQKEQVIAEFNNSEIGKDLQELKDAINNREFSSIEVK